MKIHLTCDSLTDLHSLVHWIEGQDLLTAEVSWYQDRTGSDRWFVEVEPHFHPETPVQAASCAQVWSRFVLQLLAQELCY